MTNRELDCWIAEHVFGWKWYTWNHYTLGGISRGKVKSLLPPELHLERKWKYLDLGGSPQEAGLRECQSGEPADHIKDGEMIPPFSTDASADYLVLEAVLTDSSEPDSDAPIAKFEFAVSLRGNAEKRSGHEILTIYDLAMEYQPGDYSRAYAAACGVEV